MNRCGSKLTKADSGRVSLQAQQNLLGRVSRSWRGLTGDEVTAWTSYAGTLTWYNKAGFPYTPSGYEVYCSCNLNAKKINVVAMTLPVVSTGDANLSRITVSFDGLGDLQLDNTAATTTNNGIVVYASAPQSAGVSRPKGGYKRIYSADTITTGLQSLSSSYQAVYGYLPPNGLIFFRIEIVVKDSGVVNGSKLTKADSGFI